MTKLAPYLFPALALMACGKQTDDTSTDTGIDTAVTDTAVTDTDTATDTATDTGTTVVTPDQTTAVVVTSDYTVYGLSTVNLDDMAVTPDITTLPGSSIVKTINDEIYNINQLGVDTVRVYTPGDWSAPTREWSVGNGTANPHDGVMCGGNVFISLYGGTTINAYHPETGTFVGAVDVSSYADTNNGPDFDGIPEIANLACVDDTLYAVAQQLYEWNPVGGLLIEIDPVSLNISADWNVGPNPKMIVDPTTEDSLIITSGAFYAADGGVMTFNTATGSLSDIQVAESDLNMDITAFASDENGNAIMIGSNLDNFGDTYHIFCVDMNDWSIVEGAGLNTFLQDVVTNDAGESWIIGRTHWNYPNRPGAVMVWDAETCTETARMPFGLDPYSITFY